MARLDEPSTAVKACRFCRARYALWIMSETSPTYLLPIVHRGREEFAREIGDAVRGAAARVVGRTGLIEVTKGVPDASSGAQVVVVYAGSRAGAQDSGVVAEIDKALRQVCFSRIVCPSQIP